MPKTDIAALIARARSALLVPTMYKLGTGGQDPTSAMPSGDEVSDLSTDTSDEAAKARKKAIELGIDPNSLGPLPVCDCTGFVWWVLGEKRGKRNTRWVHDDARHGQQQFRQVHPGTPLTGRPGDLLVYTVNPNASVGHMGMVTEVNAPSGEDGVIVRVIHCGARNHDLPAGPGELAHSSIAETGVEIFESFYNPEEPDWSTLVCRPRKLD